ncbi:UDP-N-acetylmuramoyl-tripeptide--D-alanyl-D-alanine ligase [Cohnella sp. CFH 77786]|uniref:UDP-N-acetylmuramoyl-tripeptide--D-alanyl-D- alanine ligase n=1 Tax=Cohnella sp. CFH 77786 TaxID=2662265 RepID=UPI00351D01B8
MPNARVTPGFIIAVTGSAGKTTTKEMIASILQKRWNTYKTMGNRNLPSSIAKQRKQILPSHRAAVLEYGMAQAGHIAKSCQTIQPDLGVITSIGTAHIGNVGGTVQGVAQAKSELIRGMHPNGALFINADNPNMKLLDTKNFKGRIYRVGTKANPNYKAFEISERPDGVVFHVNLWGKKQRFFIPVPGRHNVNNALLAVAVADRLGFTAEEIAAGLRTYYRPKSRLNVLSLKKKGAIVLDDSFSANPDAVKAAIDVLMGLGKGRKIAVLGSMLEMGVYSKKAHQDVGKYLAGKPVKFLYTFGDEAKEYGKGAIAAGFPAARVFHFKTRNRLHAVLKSRIVPGTSVLVKGSHKMKMRDTVKFLVSKLK